MRRASKNPAILVLTAFLICGAIGTASAEDPKTKRARSILFIPTHPDAFYATGADLSVSYDRASVYKGDLAAALVDLSKYDLQIGLWGTMYLQGQFALTLRSGFEVAKGFSATKLNRCAALPSKDSSISGNACGDVLFVRSADAAAQRSAYARLSVTHIPLATIGGAVPGMEIRGGFEQLGQAPRFNFRAVGFFSPDTGPLVARFGVGMDLVDILADDAAVGLTRGQLNFTPFLFVEATPEGLAKFVGM